METLHSKSLLDGEDYDSNINKPKDFPTDEKFITDNLKSALTTTTTTFQTADKSKDDAQDNRSISNCHRNDVKEKGGVTQNGNCEDSDTHPFSRHVDSTTSSACSKQTPAIETVNHGLTKVAIEEGSNYVVLASHESLCEREDDGRQISVVRLSQNGDISESECPSNEPSTRTTEAEEPSPPEPPPPPEARQQWCSAASLSTTLVSDGISYVRYENESQMADIMRLITKDLSEPYSIYTYRYFIHNWPKLCFLAMDEDTCVGAIVCKLDVHKKMANRGYIAMLAVDNNYRRRKIGSTLVRKAIRAMILDETSSCDEVVLETEITNTSALRLYENLGFVRDKRLFRYYLNGVDALRLKLWLR